LVVIAIIGILASVVLSSLSSARASARDAKRTSDLRQLQTAFELFRNNHGNFYPCSTGSVNNGNNRVYLLDGQARHTRPAGCSDMRPYISIAGYQNNSPYTASLDTFMYRSYPNTQGTDYVIRVRMEGDRYTRGFNGVANSNPDKHCILATNRNLAHSTWANSPDCF